MLVDTNGDDADTVDSSETEASISKFATQISKDNWTSKVAVSCLLVFYWT